MKTIERLRELEKAASPAPWRMIDRFGIQAGDNSHADMRFPKDGDLACAARNFLPALLAVVEAADRLVNPGTMPACMTEQAKHYTASFAKLDAALRALEGGAG